MNKFPIIMTLAATILAVGCKKDDKLNIDGTWHLIEIGEVTKSSDPYDISVYITFSDEGTFDIWQKLQEGRYGHYSGTWELDDKTLYGYYSDSTPLGAGAYSVSIAEGQLNLKALNGSEEVTVYERILSVPQDVIDNVLPTE